MLKFLGWVETGGGQVWLESQQEGRERSEEKERRPWERQSHGNAALYFWYLS